MSLRKLPDMAAGAPAKPLQWDVSREAIARFDGALRMLASDGENVVQIVGVIGEDFWADSFATMKTVQAQLAPHAGKPVTVQLNSPGGDFFEGQAIYNLLRQHDGEVTVKVFGVAASAASVIAMAGDKILMPKASWMMIHNVWGLVIGNRHDLSAMAADMEKFDTVSAQLYADRTGMKAKDVGALMDAETIMGGEEAVSKGFADEILDRAETTSSSGANQRAGFMRRLESALSRGGMSRGERKQLLNEIRTMPGAGGDQGMPSAVLASDFSAKLERFGKEIDAFKSGFRKSTS